MGRIVWSNSVLATGIGITRSRYRAWYFHTEVDLGKFLFRADEPEADNPWSDLASGQQINMILAEAITAAKILVRKLLNSRHG